MSNRQSLRLSGSRIDLFAAILLRNAAVFESLKDTLTVEHFPGESHQLFYRALLDFYAREARLPKYVEISAEIQTLLEPDPDQVADSTTEELERFLEFAFAKSTFSGFKPTSDKAVQLATTVAEQLLQSHLRSTVVSELQTADPDQLPAIFEQSQTKFELYSTVRAGNKRTEFFGKDWDKQAPLIVSSCGIGFFDKYLGGGTAAGEAYGLMAPFGTCKTTLAVMLLCEGARQCYNEFLTVPEEDKKGFAVLVSYEAPACPELQHRAMMYAAEVRRQSLVQMGLQGIASLGNNPHDPLEYEKKKFSMHIANNVFETERVRVQKCVNWLNEHAVVLDFSGRDPNNRQAGYGGVAEIQKRIRQELKARGKGSYVRTVVVDYLARMIDMDRTLQVDKFKRVDESKIISSYVGLLQRGLAVEFNCPLWLLQQLSGKANSELSPTKRMHHTDAKGSKSYAENLDFSFEIGALSEDQMGQINCSKHRRHKPMPPSIIKVDGEFNLVTSPDNYHIDSQGKIVDKSISTATGADMSAAALEGLLDTDEV